MNRHVVIFSMLFAAAGCTTTQPLVGTAPRPRPASTTPAGPASPGSTANAARTAPRAEPIRDDRFAAPTTEIRRPPPVLPSEPTPRAAPASVALLEQSRDERAAGSYAAAASSIERALRIEPNNAELWLELGEVKLEDGDPQQAEQMARKALTLAGGNRLIAARAERLLALAAGCARGGC